VRTAIFPQSARGHPDFLILAICATRAFPELFSLAGIGMALPCPIPIPPETGRITRTAADSPGRSVIFNGTHNAPRFTPVTRRFASSLRRA
jgi:hypothetical protein